VSRVAPVRAAIREGRIAVVEPWLLPTADAPADTAGVVSMDVSGHCVFHRHDRCAIHGTLGHNALPLACQHFPRVCLIDPRGVFVTLSHFCPTAATMLFDDGPVSIVEGPSALPDEAAPEGLDARDTWPPLLTERVLMDLERYGEWERHMVRVLAGEDREPSPEASLDRLRADAKKASGGESRSPETPRLFDLIRSGVPSLREWPGIPSEFQREWAFRVRPTWSAWARVVQRFLAAHAFGSWLAYQGRGLQTIVRGLDGAFAVLQVEVVRSCQARDTVLDRASLHEAIRPADLLLRHYADRQTFADAMYLRRV